eukprot:754921-Hanusia_phi.AAC.1
MEKKKKIMMMMEMMMTRSRIVEPGSRSVRVLTGLHCSGRVVSRVGGQGKVAGGDQLPPCGQENEEGEERTRGSCAYAGEQKHERSVRLLEKSEMDANKEPRNRWEGTNSL